MWTDFVHKQRTNHRTPLIVSELVVIASSLVGDRNSIVLGEVATRRTPLGQKRGRSQALIAVLLSVSNGRLQFLGYLRWLEQLGIFTDQISVKYACNPSG